jgi:hypothetical protein
MGQQFPKDYEIKIKYFLDEIKKKRKTLNISDENLILLINMDKTPIFFDSPFSSIINKKGVKQIEIVTSGVEKDEF